MSEQNDRGLQLEGLELLDLMKDFSMRESTDFLTIEDFRAIERLSSNDFFALKPLAMQVLETPLEVDSAERSVLASFSQHVSGLQALALDDDDDDF